MRSYAANGLTALASLLVVAAIGTVVLWALQRRLIYFPLADVPRSAAVGLPRAQDVSFATADGVTLHGWFVPPTAPSMRDDRHRLQRECRAPGFSRARWPQCSPTPVWPRCCSTTGATARIRASRQRKGCAEDARAAYRYVSTRQDVDPTRLVYFGESLGTGVAVRLAADRAPRALILRSPFTSMVDVGRHHYPFLPVATRAAAIGSRRSTALPISRVPCW